MKKLKLVSLLLTAIFILLTQCVRENHKNYNPIRLTALNSMQRALDGRPINGKSKVEIKAAKNEYEAFQIVISAGKNNHLQNLKIEISDLIGDNGSISRENLKMFREENVYIRNSSPRADFPPGLFPDPLLPFMNPISGDSIIPRQRIETSSGTQHIGAKYRAYPINLFPDQHCSIWVDVYIPDHTNAGTYTGSFKVTADGNISSEIPVNIKVWDFTLPEVATHRTHFGHFPLIAKEWGIDSHSEKFQEIELQFCKELARHRINPPIPYNLLPQVNDDGSLTIIPEKHKKLKQYIKETHLVDFEVPRTKFMTNTSNSSSPTPDNQTDFLAIEKSKRYYHEMYQYLKANNWEGRAYLYLIDEPNSVKDYNQVINLAKVAREAAPELKRLVVEQTYKHDPSWPDLDSSVDIWCPLFGFIDRKSIQEKIANGDEVWSYTALVQPAPSYHPEYEKVKDKNPPYWHIDRPLIMYRIPTWLNKQYDIKGLLYWTTSGWYDENGPWLVPTLAHYGEGGMGHTTARYYNGGGLLFYPGLEAGFNGPVTSIRLKNIREGLEDYEYFAILEKAGYGDFVKKMIDEICPEWWDFTQDPEVLLKVREKLAMKIESLQK